MTKTSLLVGIALAAFAARAEAGGSPGSIGVGAEYELSGLGGASLNYDAGQFHVGGFIGYADDGNNNSDFQIGGRFFYHLHSTAMSDFSVGGGLGLASDKRAAGMGNPTVRTTGIFVEPSFQIRLFVASNVALSFTGGISIGAQDAQGYALTGQGVGGGTFSIAGGAVAGILGGAGVHYYFF